MTGQPPIYVCVTNLLESRHQKKTGIPRVEIEVARYLAAEGASVIAWNGWRNRFEHVAHVLDAIARAQSLDLEAICAEPQQPHPLAAIRRAGAGAAAALARHLTTGREPARSVVRFAFRRIARAWPHLSPAERRTMASRLRLDEDTDRLGHFIDVLVEARHHADKGPRGRVEFGRGASLLLLGIWWNRKPFDAVGALKRTHGLSFIGMVHDLLPIRRPEFFTDDVGRERFTAYVDRLVEHTDAICANSTYVARDVEAYIRERQAPPRPVKPIALCSELRQRTTPTATAALKRSGLEPGRFVVFVSTINPRKNHFAAYQLWRHLVEELGEAAPTLVFAGQRGWRHEDLLRVLARDPLMWNRKLRFVEGPTDAEMAWLYAHCAFTIFPSLFEGWGLPIIESLSFGKYCLAADNTSLPEAGQGLAFHADPLDGMAWLAEIRRILGEPDYLAAMEARIRERFVARSWSDVGAEMRALIEDGNRTQPSL